MQSNDDQQKQGGDAAAFHEDDRPELRRTLRRERIVARESLSPQAHAQKSVAVTRHLSALLARFAPTTLGFYWPIRAEVDCIALVTGLLAEGWRACLPVVVERQTAMEFREWTPHSSMVAGEYGIPTVAGGAPVTPRVLLMPVNAFDRNGFRLGYGGGYYDRTVAALLPRPYCIGVSFELARTDSIFPHAQDSSLDAVSTESGIEVFNPIPPAMLK